MVEGVSIGYLPIKITIMTHTVMAADMPTASPTTSDGAGQSATK